MVNKVCYIFPGQGSQYVGMGRDLYDNSPEAKKIFDIAEEILAGDGPPRRAEGETGRDRPLQLKKLCFEGPIEELTQTANSQVAILVTSIAALQVLCRDRSRPVPTACAGLSLGEYSALVASGALKFEDAVPLVRLRGELMERASLKTPGTMASVLGLSIEDLKDICKKTNAEIANLNSPGQVVISGKRDSIEEAMALAQEKGAKKSILLNVSGPFHSSLMKDASELFKIELDKVKFSEPQVPIVSNVTADYEKTIDEIKENLVKQLYSPVRWEESVRKIASEGCAAFFEIGPGKVLKGLLRRINSDLKIYNIETTEDINKLAA